LTVYATADTGILRALQAGSGQLRWQGKTAQLAGGQPVVENGIVYAGSFNAVYAFKASDGTTKPIVNFLDTSPHLPIVTHSTSAIS
jgi:outer membrane protein assembly factor BamB